MRARWLLLALVLVVAAGCGSRADGATSEPAVPVSPAVSETTRAPRPTPTLSAEDQFLRDVRREGLAGLNLYAPEAEDWLLGVGEQTCRTFDTQEPPTAADLDRGYQVVVTLAATVLLQRADS